VAAVEGGAGIVDADSFCGICSDAIARSEAVGESFPLMEIAPWRRGTLITAGLFGQWMRIQFIGLRVRDAYDPKSENFVTPFAGQDQRAQCWGMRHRVCRYKISVFLFVVFCHREKFRAAGGGVCLNFSKIGDCHA
jgi:hypothetical protein